jgi:hypothetical protein
MRHQTSRESRREGKIMSNPVKMTAEQKKEIEDIIDGLQCPKDFRCYTSGFTNLCKSADLGMESFLKCLENDPQQCKFAMYFGTDFFCTCPLRIYIVKKLKDKKKKVV